VFTARYALSPYIKQIHFVFKGLKPKRNSCRNFTRQPTSGGAGRSSAVTIVTIRLSNPNRAKGFPSSPHRPHRLCTPPSLPTECVYQTSFPRIKRPGRDVTTHLCLGPWLTMGRVIPLLPLYAFIMCTKHFYLYLSSASGWFGNRCIFEFINVTSLRSLSIV
jgi:hypothetical protein